MQAHLLLDAGSVQATVGGVTFHLNPASRHPANPVLMPGQAHQWDGLQICWPGTVLYSPADRKFRCWYAGLDAVQSPSRCWLYGYAESDDGVHWVKPDVGQVTHLGQATNMIKPGWLTWPNDRPVPAWGTYILSCVFENPRVLENRAPESRRFGALWLETVIEADGRTRFVKALAWSPDGQRWERACTAYEPLPYARANFHDISQLLNDPDEPDPAYRVKAYSQIPSVRAHDGRPGVRHIGLLHGAGFEKLEPATEPIVLAPLPGTDEEIHFASVKKVGSDYIMLFESDRFGAKPYNGDLRLAVSDDGRRFRRVHPGSPLLPTGSRGMWDENLLVVSSDAMQSVGDEVFIYYFGCSGVFNSWPAQYEVVSGRRGALYYPVCLGLATLPRDRFAYTRGEGALTTHEVELNDEGLWINADGDGIRVRAVSHPGVEGRLSDQRRQTVYRRVRWSGREPRGRTRLELHLGPGDRLYSFAR